MNDEALKNLTNPVGINDFVDQMFGEPERKKINYSWIENPKQAIFDVYQPHEQIYLVAKIERVLQGSISKTSQPYCEKSDSEKIVNGIIKQVKSACNRIPEHRMPFCWGAVSLFDKKGSFAPGGFQSSFKGQENFQIPFGDLYRQEANKLKDEELFRFLSEIGKSGKNLDKLDRIYRPPNLSLLTVIIEPLKENEQLVDVLTSSLQPVKPYHAAGADPYFEIDTFEDIPQHLAAPFENYLNHLYIRPISLKYDTQKSFPKARNITISCELWNGDEPASSRKLCVFYTRPETRGLIFDTSRNDSKNYEIE